MPIVNAQQMKACDHYTIETIGIPAMVLMERAALAVYHEVTAHQKYDLSHVLIVTGSGNNGGDGYAIARLLHLAQIPVTIWQASSLDHATKECAQQVAICQHYPIPCLDTLTDFSSYTLIIDAFLGIGVSTKLRKGTCQVIDAINQSRVPVVAVDLPSGIDASTGDSLGCHITAQTTVTFQFEKTAFHKHPGKEAAGTVILADVGISDEPLVTEIS